MNRSILLGFILFLAVGLTGCSEKKMTDVEKAELKAEIKRDIQHHMLDAHDFHLLTVKGENGHDSHYSLPLPIILVDNGLQVFMSSKFNHGHSVAESNGNYYILHHSKIYKTDNKGTVNYDAKQHPTNVKPLDLSITKSVFSVMLVSLFIFIIFRKVAKNYQNTLLPTKFGKFAEPLVIFVRDEIAIPNIGVKNYEKFMPFLLTVFFFIWFINLTGLTPLGINVTGNVAVTASLALLTFILTIFNGKKDYWKHIFWMPGVPTPMKFVLAPIELLGVIIKPFALLIRLYANISAGHIVLMSLIGLLFVFQNWFARGAFLGLTVFLSLIELLVAFLQAYIFTMLSALYFGMAVEEHEHEHEHEEAHIKGHQH